MSSLHEYQTKALFKERGVPVPPSAIALSPKEARAAAERLGGAVWAVKAQVLAGGRGKAGGVKIVSSPEEAESAAAELLGKTLVTAQTGPAGEKVRKVLVEKGAAIDKEFYLSLLTETSQGRPIFIASSEGGTDIEEIAQTAPDKIHKIPFSPSFGPQGFHAWAAASAFGIRDKDQIRSLHSLLKNLYRLFEEKDLSLIEINPLILTDKGGFSALDGKASADENSFFRQKALFESMDGAGADEGEAEAKANNLSYIKLDGSIACMVNGAGLAMATMDIIHLRGGAPANFLDVGGSAEEEKVVKAFEIIMRAEGVKVILVNIFGGIMHCDVIASGLIKAVNKLRLKAPVAVRLAGTRAEEGRRLLSQSGLKLFPAKTLDEAALKAVELASA